MNYLGHLYLSPPDAEFRLGNLMADGLPAKKALKYPLRMRLGYRFHHWIDDFTDKHPAFRHSREVLTESQKHYAGVVVDVLYDHFLAKNWKDYSSEDLGSFAETFYTQYNQYEGQLPADFRFMMRYMIQYRWLESYANLMGLERALIGLSKRTHFQNNMHVALKNILSHYNLLESHFRSLMADITPAAKNWLSESVFF
ncbi:ACP phosphodiesterase [Thermaurantimonas aggregans]|uniref:ACP phosphodiesterase n=1 Tax=Thermaurantimonas aggregans TaxID=2173829 RepID=A0A401XI06_9FLAO|nr:acyl carrier protein phosphodiesterase [Thermaurantimonas aggregans]MCX8149201.1 acyl carrier protein phosphodiesterase [Thermaurantimonas aggregans]GCD76643.1 ACP phosphodiesterase [Thermaurantimonas aggregans]